VHGIPAGLEEGSRYTGPSVQRSPSRTRRDAGDVIDDDHDDIADPLGLTSGFRFAHETLGHSLPEDSRRVSPSPQNNDHAAQDTAASPRLASREPPSRTKPPSDDAEVAFRDAPRPAVAPAAFADRPSSTAASLRRRGGSANTLVAPPDPHTAMASALPAKCDPQARANAPTAGERVASASRGLRRGPVMKSALVAERQPALGIVAARPDLSNMVEALPAGSEMRPALAAALAQRQGNGGAAVQ
jgi:hypothetical protein